MGPGWKYITRYKLVPVQTPGGITFRATNTEGVVSYLDRALFELIYETTHY